MLSINTTNGILKKIFSSVFFSVSFIFFFSTSSVSAQQNLSLLSHLTFSPGNSCAGVWYYVDSLNREYALVGTKQGLAIVDVTVPTSPNLLFIVPGINNLWREVKTWGKYAYVTTEGTDTLNAANNGLQIVNLSFLPDSAPSKVWRGNGAIANQLVKAHTVTVDNGYVYVNGSNLGIVIASLTDPWNPNYVGTYSVHYAHDCFVRGNKMWTSEIYEGQFAVVDITNRANPVVIASHPTPGNFNHNGWLSDNSNYFFTTDEVHHAPVASFDVSNLTNINLLGTYRCTNMDTFEVHNVRVFNDYLICPAYGSQVTIVDAARPANMVEIANYPTGNGLCWDAIPFLPSGIILATDKNDGLYILAPTYIRACYLEGWVKDSVTLQTINNAL
ncbi:MAG: choice-of-anchor B family protein, partial [Bacteroidia bacterium]|nr:choice-of-anchor B family protein [Bacteroidia bacterium]